MEKSFSEILSNAPEFTEQEYQQLRQWAEQYPYAQALKVAVACAAWHLNHPHKQEHLQIAAVYAANRTVLKEWIDKIQHKKPAEAPPAPPDQPVEANIAETLLADIALLRQSMKKFEEAASQIPQRSEQATAKSKSKKQRLLEAVRQLKKEQQTQQQTPGDKPKKKTVRRKRKSESDALLEEISSRQAIEPENNKTREQIEIIDRFIEKSPSIGASPASPPQLPEQDLTTSPQDQDFSEHIVSETLVEILLRQGKKDRAIEVLKKLIWKFPQKKTYFAARIDELKK
ncbi:MAG: hypothetical protein KatS3mg032_0107 [Cyclobacteriaceae bacterium]|nr:MAG: hypothetical protein KatS3mg032_0107 [Cyclobacteriaceae bacterium]